MTRRIQYNWRLSLYHMGVVHSGHFRIPYDLPEPSELPRWDSEPARMHMLGWL